MNNDEYPYDCSEKSAKPEPESIASELVLSRGAHNDSIVLVEGDNDDFFYGQFFDKNNCKLIPVCGNKNVIDTIPLVNNLNGILGIIDADFTRFDKLEWQNPNILRTDFHDIEIMMIASESLDKILKNYADIRTLTEFEKQKGNKIRQILLNSAIYIAYIRHYSQKNKKNWDFKALVFSDFISSKTLEINIEGFQKELKRNNLDLQNETKKNLLPRLNKEFVPFSMLEDQLQLCNGHDVLRILYIGLTQIFPHKKQKLKSLKQLEEALRIAYYERIFKSTTLFCDINNWEISNPPFIVLNYH
jgi:hypothetical protein